MTITSSQKRYGFILAPFVVDLFCEKVQRHFLQKKYTMPLRFLVSTFVFLQFGQYIIIFPFNLRCRILTVVFCYVLVFLIHKTVCLHQYDCGILNTVERDYLCRISNLDVVDASSTNDEHEFHNLLHHTKSIFSPIYQNILVLLCSIVILLWAMPCVMLCVVLVSKCRF